MSQLNHSPDNDPPQPFMGNVYDGYDTPIEYSFCHSDYDPGRFERNDLNHVTEHEEVIQTQLTAMGLSFSKKDFLSGRGYDLLFLKNHGLIAKVGKKHDPIDFIHPCFIQPIGWQRDEATDITTCLYAGEKTHNMELSIAMFDYKQVTSRSGQSNLDLAFDNMGCFPSGEQTLPLAIDIDAGSNRTLSEDIKYQKQELFEELSQDKSLNMADINFEIMHQVYKSHDDLKPWMRQMDRHQDLRQLYWQAQQIPLKSRGGALKKFFDTAALRTHNPPKNTYPLYQDYLTPR